MVFAQEPGRDGKRGDEPAGEDAASLQRSQAEDLSGMLGVGLGNTC